RSLFVRQLSNKRAESRGSQEGPLRLVFGRRASGLRDGCVSPRHEESERKHWLRVFRRFFVRRDLCMGLARLDFGNAALIDSEPSSDVVLQKSLIAQVLDLCSHFRGYM